ncbi:MAG: dihydrodipicolinate synthase family protein [Treponema sp.]|jgi:4-hydroxy-tetrahydrodipicolinate synthase|nr:dihydrodipicolinate synthase family protein [Treponema sp.]
MTSITLSGPYAVLATPFTKDARPDLDAVGRHVELLCATDIRGIVPCGSSAEFVNLSFEENTAILREVARVNAGRKQVIAGATGPDAFTTLKYLDLMGNLGLDAALIAPPYYFKYSDDEILAFYKEIGAPGFPVTAYNIPAFTNPISLTVYSKLLDMDHIKAMKNSSANIKEIMHQIELKNETRRDFQVLTGTDDAIVPCVVGGCTGSFTLLGSIMPETICRIYDALGRGDIPGALQIQNQIQPVIRAADSFPFPLGYKLIALVKGFDVGRPRQSISEKTQSRILPALEIIYESLKKVETGNIPEDFNPVRLIEKLWLN